MPITEWEALPEAVTDCFGFILHAKVEAHEGRFGPAHQALAVALLKAREMPPEFLPDFRAAHVYAILAVQSRQRREDVGPEKRSLAAQLLGQPSACDSVGLYQSLMFDLLAQLGEHQRAIPFAERALGMAVEKKDSSSIGFWLLNLGRCYARLGLRDHAEIVYRAAARVFRNEPGDPRLPHALLELGSSVRKSVPSEAEALYKEAAAWWEAKGQLESATPAWSNLGILCSDQRRFEEALDYYERVRRVRESSPGTSRARVGIVYNNLGSCYRKMGRFREAHAAVDRAIAVLSEPGTLSAYDPNSLASCLGTKGLILRDEGRDLESIEWFRRACAGFEHHPTPNFENIIEELEHEEAALTRLNRADEAREVRERIQSVQKRMGETPIPSHNGVAERASNKNALLIEMDGGMREANYREIATVGVRLSEILEERKLGDWHSLIRVPECSTLIFYGPDADAMFAAVEPDLRTDLRFAGATVTIRQGAQQRQVLMPHRTVN